MVMQDASIRPEGPSPVPQSLALGLEGVRLSNFRSYAYAELELARAPVVLAGANGSGKTNLLEALSLFSPGRSLRGANLTELQCKAPALASDLPAGTGSLWAVSASLARPDGGWDIGCGLAKASSEQRATRVLHLNGAPSSAAEIAELLPMLWLTPALDRLFLEGASERRRFLDRLVFALDSSHARRAARYERAMHERNRLLRERVFNAVWLDGLEETMAREGNEISAARLSTIERLNAELALRDAAGVFPCAHLSLSDAMGERATDSQALQTALQASRQRDAESGRSSVGPHLADLTVRYAEKDCEARDCSTGEQKALLISIVLANAWLQTKLANVAPLLLLDEIAAHLDGRRRAALFEEILALKAQAWLTGTDKSLFAGLLPHAQCFSILSGQFVRQD